MTEVTVLMATHNGGKVLRRTLEGYCGQQGVEFDWKLVVVDNNSTDNTNEVIEHFKKHLRIDSVFEPRPGKNRALNAGLGSIEGDIIIISDDDAIPRQNFLTAWRTVMSRELDYDLFGGSIEPLFDVQPPKWMLERRSKFEALFSARSLADGPVSPGEIYGPNMAVRRSVFSSGLKFDESVGPNGSDTNYPMGSETEFCVRAHSRGHKARFSKEPFVWHIVRAHQVRQPYWCQRAYRFGRGQAQILWAAGPPQLRFGYSAVGRATRIASQYLRQSVDWLRALRIDPERRFEALWSYHAKRGIRDEFSRRIAAHHGSQAFIAERTPNDWGRF